MMEPWTKNLAEDNELWIQKDLLETLPNEISYQYDFIYETAKNGEEFGIFFALKDFFEILIRFDTLLSLLYLKARKKSDEPIEIEKLFIKDPITLGSWLSIASRIKNEIDEETLNKNLKTTIDFFNKHNVVSWRNDCIGHGPLGALKREENKEKVRLFLLAIKHELLLKKLELYGKIKVEDKGPSYYCTISSFTFSLDPYITKSYNGAYFFDTYYASRNNIRDINYPTSDIRIKKAPYFKDAYISFFNTVTEKNIKGIVSEEYNALLNDLNDSDKGFLKPDHLVSKIEYWLTKYSGGVFLLSLERGMGKSTFSYRMDERNKGCIKLKEPNILSRTYFISRESTLGVKDFSKELESILFRESYHSQVAITSFEALCMKEENPAKALLNYLSSYKEAFEKENKILLFIDGVDEIRFKNSIILDILKNIKETIDGIYIVFTSRNAKTEDFLQDTKDVLESVPFTDTYSLEAKSEDNVSFLKNYLSDLKNISDEDKEKLISLSESKILYLSFYKSLLKDYKIGIEKIYDSTDSVKIYLENIICTFPINYRKYVKKTLFYLSLCTGCDTLDIEELAYLVLKNEDIALMLSIMNSIKPLLKISREEGVSRYSFVNEDISIAVKNFLDDALHIFIEEYRKREGILDDRGLLSYEMFILYARSISSLSFLSYLFKEISHLTREYSRSNCNLLRIMNISNISSCCTFLENVEKAIIANMIIDINLKLNRHIETKDKIVNEIEFLKNSKLNNTEDYLFMYYEALSGIFLSLGEYENCIKFSKEALSLSCNTYEERKHCILINMKKAYELSFDFDGEYEVEQQMEKLDMNDETYQLFQKSKYYNNYSKKESKEIIKHYGRLLDKGDYNNAFYALKTLSFYYLNRRNKKKAKEIVNEYLETFKEDEDNIILSQLVKEAKFRLSLISSYDLEKIRKHLETNKSYNTIFDTINLAFCLIPIKDEKKAKETSDLFYSFIKKINSPDLKENLYVQVLFHEAKFINYKKEAENIMKALLNILKTTKNENNITQSYLGITFLWQKGLINNKDYIAWAKGQDNFLILQSTKLQTFPLSIISKLLYYFQIGKIKIWERMNNF